MPRAWSPAWAAADAAVAGAMRSSLIRCLALAGAAFLLPPAGWAAEPAVHTVRIAAFAFGPVRLEIRTGDTVEWVNEDLVPHTATAAGGGWDTGGLRTGDAGSVSFRVPGTHAYRCAYHPQMRGEIVVVDERAGPTFPRSASADASR